MPWTPTRIAPPDTHPKDPRIGHLLQHGVDAPAEARVVIAGFPSDEGVRRNGGRPGASEAPDYIRRHLYTLTPDPENAATWGRLLATTVDLGDLQIEPDNLAENQKLLGSELAPYLSEDSIVIILGGGHETAFAHFQAYAHAELSTSIVNWDAHLDVRPLIGGRPHSGSSFRQAIEHESDCCQSYTAAGALRHSVAQNHLQYVRQNGGSVHWREEVDPAFVENLYANLQGPAMVTLDFDAVDQSAAPGVSAPASGGLSVQTWLNAAYVSGRSKAVRSIDLSEVNPRVDEGTCTGRLAALTLWHVLRGLVDRLS